MNTPFAPHEVDRLREAFAALADRMTGREDCPTAERIWDAVGGRLSPEDTADVVAHTAECSGCAEAWRLACDLEPLAPRSVELSPSRTQAARPAKVNRRPFLWLVPAAAAAVVIVAAAVAPHMWRRPVETPVERARPVAPPASASESSAPFVLSFEKPPVRLAAARALVFRGRTTDSFLDDFGRAIDPYRRGDFAEAVARLEAVARKYPDAVEPQFYLGASFLLMNRPADAVAPLKRAVAHAEDPLGDDARWCLAVASQAAGDIGTARSELGRLCGVPGAYRDRACRALGGRPAAPKPAPSR